VACNLALAAHKAQQLQQPGNQMNGTSPDSLKDGLTGLKNKHMKTFENAYLVQVLQIHRVLDHGINYVREFGYIS
jgi:hypothetical protein